MIAVFKNKFDFLEALQNIGSLFTNTFDSLYRISDPKFMSTIAFMALEIVQKYNKTIGKKQEANENIFILPNRIVYYSNSGNKYNFYIATLSDGSLYFAIDFPENSKVKNGLSRDCISDENIINEMEAAYYSL